MNIITEPVPVFSEIRLVTFSLNNSQQAIRFGINAHKVREVIEFSNFEQLPPLYAPFFAVINLRGIPVPLMDLDSVLYGDKESEKSNDQRVIICEILGKLTGIVASKSIKMIEVKNDRVLPVTFNTGKLNSEFLSGIIEQDNHYLYMINLENILDEFSNDSSENNSEATPDYSGKKILIVEDSKLYRKKMEGTFKKMKFNVTLAEDGLAGLEALRADHGFDLIFSDIEMPNINGIEMAREIKSNSLWNKIPLIFHSSISNSELIKQIHEENLGQYIVKFDEKLINDTIQRILSP